MSICPTCRHYECVCDFAPCGVCDRPVHEERSVCCEVPGCGNDHVCDRDACREFHHGLPVCTSCVNSLAADYAMTAVAGIASRRALRDALVACDR